VNPSTSEHFDRAISEHAAFVRNLARSLVFDEQGAEDVAQETWLAALRHLPEPSAGIRAWLAKVASNFAYRKGRGETRRSAREQLVARPEASSQPATDPAQAVLLREITDFVLALSEPYRSTVFMRYYADLQPAEIAKRLRIPGGTVRTQLKRALDQLRERLDAEHGGDRGAWKTRLAPIAIGVFEQAAVPAAASSIAGSALTLGGVLMAKKIACIGGLAAVLLMSVVVMTRSGGDPEPPLMIPLEIADAAPASTVAPGANTPAPVIRPRPHVPGDDDREPLEAAVAQKGAPHATIVGRVVDQRGAAQAGVPVSLDVVRLQTGQGPVEPEDEKRVQVWTSEDGRFTFPDVPLDVEARVRARPGTLCDVSRPASIPAPGVVDLGDLVAVTGGAIAGVVVDSRGMPVKGCKVHAWPREGSASASGMIRIQSLVGKDTRSTVTSDDGRYRVDGLPEGECALEACSADHPGESRSGVRVRKNEVTWEVDFKLTAGVTLAGIVRGGDGGPIAGVEVTATPKALKIDDPERPLIRAKSATTSVDGRFAINGLRQEPFSLRARKAGFVPASHRGAAPGTEVELVLETSGLVFGHVRNAVTNAPVSSYSMTVVSDEPLVRGPTGARVLRGAEAAKAAAVDESADLFAVLDLPETPVRLVVRAGDLAVAEAGAVRVAPGDKTEVDILLQPQAIVRGLVVDPAGGPVAGARVTAIRTTPEGSRTEGQRSVLEARRRVFALNGGMPAVEAPELVRPAVTGSDGAFALNCLPGGDYRLTASHPASAAVPAAVTVKQGGVADGIKLVVEVGGTFAGRAMDADGRPLAGIRVQLRPKSARRTTLLVGLSASEGRAMAITNTIGAFEMTGIGAGEYLASLVDSPSEGTVARVRFSDGDEHDDVPVTIEAGRRTHKDLRRSPRASLTGVVREAGKPAAGVRISLVPKGVPAIFGQSPMKTDERGAFLIDEVAPGDYTVLIDPPGAALRIRKRVSLAPRDEQRLAIDLPSGAIEGRVTDRASGEPVAGVTLSVANAQPQPEETLAMGAAAIAAGIAGNGDARTVAFGAEPAVTDSDGRFRLRYLEPGKYRVSVGGPGITTQSRSDVEVAEGHTTRDVDLGIDKEATLLVTVDPAGHAVSSVVARIQRGENGGSHQPQAGDAKSPLRFAGLRAGRYHVRIDAPMSDLEGESDVEVAAGREARITIRLVNKQ
jgi:RNA polymerase sigma-70 factor (ECF subfamily)